LYNQSCTTFVTTIFSLFLLDNNNREKEKERIKKHVSMRERVVQKLSKIVVHISFFLE